MRCQADAGRLQMRPSRAACGVERQEPNAAFVQHVLNVTPRLHLLPQMVQRGPNHPVANKQIFRGRLDLLRDSGTFERKSARSCASRH